MLIEMVEHDAHVVAEGGGRIVRQLFEPGLASGRIDAIVCVVSCPSRALNDWRAECRDAQQIGRGLDVHLCERRCAARPPLDPVGVCAVDLPGLRRECQGQRRQDSVAPSELDDHRGDVFGRWR